MDKRISTSPWQRSKPSRLPYCCCTVPPYWLYSQYRIPAVHSIGTVLILQECATSPSWEAEVQTLMNPILLVQCSSPLTRLPGTCSTVSGHLQEFYLHGARHQDKPRPHKIVLESESDVRNFLRNFSSETVAQMDLNLSSIRVSRHRTQREMEYFKSLKSELEFRLARGEKGLKIMYKNHIPQIAKNSKND